jgi:hypothetical protein
MMGKTPNFSLRWKKSKSIVTYVLPNSEVQPEVIGGETDSPRFVYVHRVHENFIQHIFGDSEIVALQRILTGNDIAQYEPWKAPHLPPVDRHTKYVFKDTERNLVSAPLYVCAPVQVTLETKSDTSSSVGAKLVGSAHSGFGRSRTVNVQVSAAIDPLVRLEVTTPHQSDGKSQLDRLIRNYAAGLSAGSNVDPDKIYSQLHQRYSEYIKGTGVIEVRVEGRGHGEWIHVDEGESVNIPLRFDPKQPGRMLLVVAAVDDLGNQVFSDFVGLRYDRDSGEIIQDF